MPSSPTTTMNIAGVETIEDNCESDEESNISSSSSEDPKNGALLRTGSEAGNNSRTSSMRAKPIKKIPPPTAENQLCDEEVREALEETRKAKTTGQANLHSLHLGLDSNLIKNLLQNDLTNLRELILSENCIESLPHNIFDKLRNLVKLDLTNNKLTMIPMSAMCLPRLQVLLLDHNFISSVPATYDIMEPLLLPELHTIGLEWNRLTEFPSHLHEIAPSLRKIYICENLGIQNLPPVESFPLGETRTEVRLDNRPTLMEQYRRGGYEARIAADWNKIYPDKVIDFVFLGSLRTAQCSEVYRDLDIKYVLTAGRNLEVYLPEGMIQLELPLDDVPGENISLFFKDAFDFIDKAIAEKKGVLLHCFAGLSRSVTVMVAYLMKTNYPIKMREALQIVKQARPNSHPNDGFIRSLEAYEDALVREHK
jgi:protein-tyrosine phosphatase